MLREWLHMVCMFVYTHTCLDAYKYICLESENLLSAAPASYGKYEHVGGEKDHGASPRPWFGCSAQRTPRGAGPHRVPKPQEQPHSHPVPFGWLLAALRSVFPVDQAYDFD